MTEIDPIWTRAEVVAHAALIIRSFRDVVGRDLLPASGDPARDSQRLFEAPFALLSHGVEADPVLNYGNAAALRLWGMGFDEFTQTPSRLTAEPMLREERQRLLEKAAALGYVDDYAGVRISARGDRFRIEDVILWTLVDEGGVKRGQAAVFDRWTFLR